MSQNLIQLPITQRCLSLARSLNSDRLPDTYNVLAYNAKLILINRRDVRFSSGSALNAPENAWLPRGFSACSLQLVRSFSIQILQAIEPGFRDITTVSLIPCFRQNSLIQHASLFNTKISSNESWLSLWYRNSKSRIYCLLQGIRMGQNNKNIWSLEQ